MIGINKFSHLREEHNIKQKELANHLNVTVSAISHYETGVNDPDLKSLILLSDYYKVSIDYLVGKSDFKHSLGQQATIDMGSKTMSCGQLIDAILDLDINRRGELMRYIEFLNYDAIKTKKESE